jgi:multicomponent Na+:H+ antiporter subunit E
VSRAPQAPRPAPSGSRDTLRVAVVVLWSIVVWVALWGDLTVANVLWGGSLGLGTLRLLPVTHQPHRVPVRPLPAVRFVLLFLWSLVRASAIVAWEVVTPRNDINEGIVAIPLQTDSPGLVTLLANSVSLTPGTLTLEVRPEPPTLYVHVLHLRAVEDVRADIHHLEEVALAAFGEDADAPGRNHR